MMPARPRIGNLLAVVITVLISSPTPGRADSPVDTITEAALRAHVYYLASDALEGRYLGSRGYDVAAEYAASQFRAAGLLPAITLGEQATYRQDVPVVKRTLESALSLTVRTPRGERTFADPGDFRWLQGQVFPWDGRPLDVVYAGYGISEPRLGWDDLGKLDVKNRVVLLLMGAPLRDGKPVLPDSVHALYAPPSAIFRKMIHLMNHGAAGILLVPDPMILENWDGLKSMAPLPSNVYNNTDPGALQIPFLFPIRPKVADALFEGQAQLPPGVGTPPAEGTIEGFPLQGVSVTLQGSFVQEDVPAWNVVGLVPGSDPVLHHEFVTVTAHLDGPAPRQPGEIYNGADDNASGCAGVIEVAKAVARRQPKRSVLFVLFTGEEAPLVGSRHFISRCPVPVAKIVADVDLDMIGRTDPASQTDRAHYAIDSEKITPAFTDLIREVNGRTLRWPLKYHCPTGNSDNISFDAAGIPAVSFYSGHHEDANRPTDDAEKLDYEKTQRISQLVYEVTMELANREKLW